LYRFNRVSTTAAIVSLLLAAIMVAAAARKLTHRAAVVAEYARVGVPEERLNHLALILLAGAAGLLLGLAWAPVGRAAAAGTVAYFLLAVAAHVRHRELANIAVPVAIELLALAALLLQAVS
jgi:hypothetical protein